MVDIPRDSDPRKTALARTSSIHKRQIRPLVREGAPQKQDRNCQMAIDIWSWTCLVLRLFKRLKFGLIISSYSRLRHLKTLWSFESKTDCWSTKSLRRLAHSAPASHTLTTLIFSNNTSHNLFISYYSCKRRRKFCVLRHNLKKQKLLVTL
jgi:hypothetical protein